MSLDKETLKNKIIYRASYRGTKEMDLLMTSFVKYILNSQNITDLIKLDEFVNMDDQKLLNIRNGKMLPNINDEILLDIFKIFKSFKM